jgi:hypothetical protein
LFGQVDHHRHLGLLDESGQFPALVVLDDEGRELVRFVEEAEVPMVVHLAEQLEDAAPSTWD